MLLSQTIAQNPFPEAKNLMLDEIACLIRSGYSAYEIQHQLNIGRGALNLQEKLFQNTFS